MAEEFTADENTCVKSQRVLSKFGYTIVCSEEELEDAIIVSENCDNAMEVARKYGYTVLCDA